MQHALLLEPPPPMSVQMLVVGVRGRNDLEILDTD